MSEIQFTCYRDGKIARIAVKPFGDIKWWLYFEHTESEIRMVPPGTRSLSTPRMAALQV